MTAQISHTTEALATPGEAQRPSRAAYAERRLRLAFFDLGLDSLVDQGWVRMAGEQVMFAPLSPRAADRLAHRWRIWPPVCRSPAPPGRLAIPTRA